MKYSQLSNDQKFILSLSETMFPNGEWNGISDKAEWSNKSILNSMFTPWNFQKIFEYLNDKYNFHYNQWQSDFKPDKGLCPDNKTLEEMRANKLLCLTAMENCLYAI